MRDYFLEELPVKVSKLDAVLYTEVSWLEPS
jgi:hypothetical protein